MGLLQHLGQGETDRQADRFTFKDEYKLMQLKWKCQGYKGAKNDPAHKEVTNDCWHERRFF